MSNTSKQKIKNKSFKQNENYNGSLLFQDQQQLSNYQEGQSQQIHNPSSSSNQKLSQRIKPQCDRKFVRFDKIALFSFIKSNKLFFMLLVTIVLVIMILCYFGAYYITQKYKLFEHKRPFQYVCLKNSLKNNNLNTIDKEFIQSKYKIRQQFRPQTPTPKSYELDLYEFKKSVYEVIKENYQYQPYNSHVNKKQFDRAIRLMEVTHNINIKGQFILDNFDYYSCPQQKYLSLQQVLKQQKQYYDKKYQIQKYRNDQIRLCVFVTSFNNAKKMRLYLRNLDSIFQQDYQNYYLVYFDDNSPDKTGQYVQKYMNVNEIPKEKYILVRNKERMGSGSNFYRGLYEYCQLGEIFVIIDGDDSLVGRQVFSVLNAVYQKQKVVLTYGQYLWVQPNRIFVGWSEQIPLKNLQQGTYRQLGYFYPGHLKTFYVDLFRQVKMQDLKYPNGTFYSHATDLVMMTPLVELAGTRSRFINQLFYEYRTGSGTNEDYDGQQFVRKQVYNRKPYHKSNDLTFADNPKTTHYS